ncbi:MAG: PKD domain-containing protein [Anaerolineae bacterium]
MKTRIVVLASLITLLSISGVVNAYEQPAAAESPMTGAASALLQADVTPPDTVLTVGSPRYSSNNILWVSARTLHTLTGVDDVDPPTAVETLVRFYRLPAAGTPDFQVYTSPFNLSGFDGRYQVDFFSRDTAGNTEPVNSQVENLDTTPPLTTWTVGTPVYYDDFGQPWITNETLHTLEAEDSAAPDGSPGSGLREIRYQVAGGPAAPSSTFIIYETPFAIDGPDGEYNIDLFAVDNVENQGQLQTVQAFLDTTPPAVDIDGPYANTEGTEFTFDATGTIDAGSGLAEIVWDLNGDAVFDDATGPTASRTFADDGSYFIGIKATDNLGNNDIVSTSVDVSNANPVVLITDISTTQPYPGQLISLEGSFSDAGWLDTHTAVVDWGDGQSSQATVSEFNEPPQGTGTWSAQHSYSTMGDYNITITVTDDDGGSGTASTQTQVGLSPQMPGTLIATDELMFYRFTGSTPGTWGSAQWQWRSGQGNPRYWWIGQGQDYLFLFLKTPNDAPSYDPNQPTAPWLNFSTIAVPQEDFQHWFWCGIYLYDEHHRTIGIGCDPQWSPPPDGAGYLHPWIVERMQEAEPHIESIVQATFQP